MEVRQKKDRIVVTTKGVDVVVTEDTIIIWIPIIRHGHDHDDLLKLKITDFPGEVDESRGYMNWIRKPRLEIDDPRFIEVVCSDTQTPILPRREVSSQGSEVP